MQLDYARIDPELLPVLSDFPSLDINRDNVYEIRELIAAGPRPPMPASVEAAHRVIDTPDGDLGIHIYRKSDRPGQAALLWIHGGGYVMGSAEDHRAGSFAELCDITVFSVDYRLAPEHPYPAPMDDCQNALNWLFDNADSLGIDAGRIAIGGASAGGGLAAGLALRNRDTANHPVCFQLLIYPMIDNLHATASGQIENHPIWTRSASFNAWEMYLNGELGPEAPLYAAPARATELAGLPPAYVCVGVEDLFRDEDMDYARRLMAADVPCELALFPGVYHAAEVFTPDAVVSKRLNASVVNALADALG